MPAALDMPVLQIVISVPFLMSHSDVRKSRSPAKCFGFRLLRIFDQLTVSKERKICSSGFEA